MCLNKNTEKTSLRCVWIKDKDKTTWILSTKNASYIFLFYVAQILHLRQPVIFRQNFSVKCWFLILLFHHIFGLCFSPIRENTFTSYFGLRSTILIIKFMQIMDRWIPREEGIFLVAVLMNYLVKTAILVKKGA